MLGLTRRVGERIIIGNKEVIITVMRIKGNQVSIGIDAPDHVSIHREEIFNKLQEELKNGKV